MRVFIVVLLLLAFTAKPNEGKLKPKCNFADGGVSSTEIDLIVNLHNQLRNEVALGTVNGQQASNMLQISWDSTLAQLAQTWADKCNYAHNHPTDNDYLNVGQNIALSEANYMISTNFSWAIYAWFNEVYDPGYPPPGTKISTNNGYYPFIFSDKTGHYTQIIWANTSHVGCGYSKFKPKSTVYNQALFYVCNYGPAGNYENLNIYKIGPSASECPYNTQKSTSYSGLCA